MSESVHDFESYEQDTDISLMLALGRHVSRKSFVDVGAEKGSFSRALLDIGFHGALFEPFPAHLPGLRRLVEGTASRVFDIALDETDHEGSLHIAVDAEGKPKDYFHSLIRNEPHPFARHAQTVPVQCRSLESLAQEGLISSEIGILKIDTEGNDLNVIRGMGNVRAEVLICEFVTPSLYSTWTGSFPEALAEAAVSRGFDACIAVKRMARHELVVFDPAGFIDGQWGNLIFASRELLARARTELSRIAYEGEKVLVASLARDAESLGKKEAVIRDLASSLARASEMVEEKEAAIQELTASWTKASEMVEKKEAAIQELTASWVKASEMVEEKEAAIQKLASSLTKASEALEEKEVMIAELAVTCEVRLAGMKELSAEVERLRYQGSPSRCES